MSDDVPRPAIFARAMLHARERTGLTQMALAERCGCDATTISRRESGGAPGLESSIESTAAGLGISVRQMLLEELAPGKAKGRTFDPGERHVLSKVCRNVRLSLGLKQRDYGARIGRHQTRVAHRESGSALSEASIDEDAAALGMSTADFLVLGLTWEAPPALADIDRGAVQRRCQDLIDRGVVLPAVIADELKVHRSVFSRLLGGATISQGMLGRIAMKLDEAEQALTVLRERYVDAVTLGAVDPSAIMARAGVERRVLNAFVDGAGVDPITAGLIRAALADAAPPGEIAAELPAGGGAPAESAAAEAIAPGDRIEQAPLRKRYAAVLVAKLTKPGDLAAKLGLPTRHLTRFRAGSRLPEAALLRLARALDELEDAEPIGGRQDEEEDERGATREEDDAA